MAARRVVVPEGRRCSQHAAVRFVVAAPKEDRVCCTGERLADLCDDCRAAYVASTPKDLAAGLRASEDLSLRIRLALFLDYPETEAIRAAVAQRVPPPTSTAELTRLLVASRSAGRTPQPMPKPRIAAVHEDSVGAEMRDAESVAAPPAPATAVLAERIRTARAASHRR